MKVQEGNQVELKRQIEKSIVKDIVAFVNTKGGQVYIGVDDDGSVVGVENIRKEYDRISAMLTDNIHPSLYLLIDCSIREVENKQIIAISVLEGNEKPYYIKAKGLTTSGVFLRDAARSIAATESQIRRMLLNYSPISFELAVTSHQALTFQYTSDFFRSKGIPFEENHLKSLNFTDKQGKYTNLALLFSDQCPYEIRASKFSGTGKGSQVEAQSTITGSVLQQREDALSFVNRFNYVKSTYENTIRLDQRDYPEFSLREAVVNSIVHRDYSNPNVSNFINVYLDKTEVVSYGGLVAGITEADIVKGFSAPRNTHLSAIFYRLGLMEQYGYGIPRIYEDYRGSGFTPTIMTSPNVFRLFLPNRHYSDYGELDMQERIVLEHIAIDGPQSRKDIEALLKLSQSTALRVINDMIDKNLLKKVGSGPATRYTAG